MRYVKLVFGAVLISAFFSVPVSALTYTRDVDVQFTFVSNLSVSIDSADIEILDLTPGQQKDSNVINISVSTNSIAGYTVSATTGNSSTYNTTNMVHTNGTNTFTSLAENASESTLSTDNTWGYAVSPEVESWTTFSGLPIYTDTAKEIAKTDGPSTDITKFKIHAKAAADQPAGDYRNVINFTVVANTPPRTIGDVLDENPNTPRDPETGLYTIQSIDDSVCEAVEAINDSFTATDIRDHKNYRVVKLKDGNCWMQDNLALDLTMANASSKITSSNTNANSAALNALFGTATRDASIDPSGNLAVAAITPWTSGWAYDEPMIYTEAMDDTNSEETIEEVQDAKFGVYYNQCAASAGSFCYSYGGGGNGDKPDTAVDIEYDVCPSNWRLPTSDYYYGYYPSESYSVDGGELQKLYEYYYESHGAELRKDLLLPIAGQFSFPSGQMENIGSNGNYWAATSSGIGGGYGYWVGTNDYINPRNDYPGVFGYNIRCIVKTSKLAINFDKGDGYGNMAPQLIKHGYTVKLDKNQYARWGYLFNGWNTKADGTGVGYRDGDTFTATTDASVKRIKLYAQWVEDTGQGSGSLGKTLQDAYEQAYVNNPGQFPKDGGGTKHGLYVPHKNAQGQYDGTYFEATQQSDYDGIPAKDLRFAMQDIDLEINGVKVCDYATVIGSEAYVLDLRDYKSYWIAKLADGKCWMTQNLDHNIVTTPGYYTPDNTDIIENWTPLRATVDASGGASVNWGSVDYNTPHSVDVGDWYWTDTYYDTWYPTEGGPYYNFLVDGESEKFRSTPFPGNGTHGHVGNFYNWSAALAMNDTSSYSSSTYYTDLSGNPQTSICPQGWRLPTIHYDYPGNDPKNEFGYLIERYGGQNGETDMPAIAAPLYFVRSGYFVSSGNDVVEAGNDGFYWSSTVSYSSTAYQLRLPFGSSSFADSYGYRDRGSSIRCVAR